MNKKEIFLNSKFEERHEIKSLGGAHWKPDVKKWAVYDDIDLSAYKRWLPDNIEPSMTSFKQQPKTTGSSPSGAQSLSSLINEAKSAIAGKLPMGYWITADISKITKRQYYRLDLVEYNSNKKPIAQTGAIIWESDIKRIVGRFEEETGEPLKENISILLKVKISLHQLYGVQMTVLDIDPSFSVGAAELKKRNILKKLNQLDLYSKNKNFKEIDFFTNVAVISPNSAAALGDFRTEADVLEKNKFCSFSYFSAVFSGDKACGEIVNAFKQVDLANKTELFDCIVFIRGGGSRSDLDFVDEYFIAEQVANAKIPVFVGIGHQQDRSIADDIAFKSFDTPSKVVRFIFDNISGNINKVISLRKETVFKFDKYWDILNNSLSKNKERILNSIEDLEVLNKTSFLKNNSLKDKINSSIFNLKTLANNLHITNDGFKDKINNFENQLRQNKILKEQQIKQDKQKKIIYGLSAIVILSLLLLIL